MLTAIVLKEFEELWKRRGIFHADLSYGQALAQYTKCGRDDPDSLFLCTSKYPAIKTWALEKIDANSKIQVEAVDNPSDPATFKNAH